MAFKAKRDGEPCPKCKIGIGEGELVQWADADRKVTEHVDCQSTEEPTGEEFVRWENVTEETLERTERAELELLQVAPLGPQGVCPKCRLELPKSKICGTC
jgi:hypothetical protein